MYIKYVRLKGFRTYKELSVFSFSQGYNAIGKWEVHTLYNSILVGLNGSGKSNVFLAISFVLGESLSEFNRANFLYKGDQSSMSEDFTAFAEVVFDISSDKNLSSCLNDSKELCLKRVFSESKDVYMVNGKSMRPKEYRQLLESMNLINSEKSQSSDLHYVVMQGSVSKMASASAEERLGVFREVVGHKSFDLKIEDSLKILQESTITYNSLEAQFQQVSRKLSSLESQQKELENWKGLDTKRKVLQCNLMLLKIEEVESSLKKAMEDEAEQSKMVSDLQKKFDFLDSQLKKHKSYLKSISESSCDEKSKELNNLQSKYDEISNEISGLESEISGILYSNENYNKELSELSTNIRKTSTCMDELSPKMALVSESISRIEIEVNDLLYKKANAAKSLAPSKTSEEVQTVISKLEKQKKFLNQTIKDHEMNNKKMQESLRQCENDLKRIRNDLYNSEMDKNRKLELYEKQRVEMELSSESKRAKQKQLSTEMLKLSKLKLNLVQAQEDFKKVSFSNQQVLDLISLWLNQGTNKSDVNSNNNLNNNNNITSDEDSEDEDMSDLTYESLDHSNFVGVLIDIITVKDEYKIAIEQVLRSKLFTIVVSNIQYAKSLVNFIESKRSKYTSNIRIISLDLLNQDPESKSISKVVDENVIPLKDCVNYDPKLDVLIDSLLKDFNLVPDSETAIKLLSKNQNSVTLNGEIFYYNGIVSGGYTNLTDSTLLTYKKLKNAQDEYDKTENKIKLLNSELDEINKMLEDVKLSYNLAKEEYNSSFEQYNSLTISLNNLTSFEESLKLKMDEDKQTELKNQIKLIDDQINSFKESLNARKDRKHKNDDTEEIDGKLERNYSSLADLKNEMLSLDGNKQQLKSKYNELSVKRDDLSKKIIINKQMLNDYKHHLEELKQTLKEVETTKNNDKIEEVNLQILKLENENKSNYFKLQQETSKLKSIAQLKSSITLALSEYNSQLNCMDVKVRESAKLNMIKERGLVLDKLAQINKECSYLDYSSHVSLKDCNDLKDEFEQLSSRKHQILLSKEEIYKSIKKLKTEKDKNLVDLVTTTNGNIGQIFQQLVPNGKIKLALIKKDKHKSAEAHLPECIVVDNDENFSGLDIKVSFNPASEDAQINQLSGGQKTLVSLAFILSLQKLKPAPFYLLDEVDSALDDQYRSKLAKLLEKQTKEGSQIVVTTFREQLLKPAQVFYEVVNENGTSCSKEITLNRAMEVVKQEPLPLTN
ncbi:chromosome segregation protein [Theileria orientalis]|uniref:Structural maintenance of chromosomes protein n=1 Tax=Theileria orientalis TaxID=68886 RepID=A0A976SIZ9_THEOR|nr:chromosome segregation protein [Theileria orientalis]